MRAGWLGLRVFGKQEQKKGNFGKSHHENRPHRTVLSGRRSPAELHIRQASGATD
jgi:hypothetical protein